MSAASQDTGPADERSAASAAPSQRGRLLMLHTVLGEDVLCAESATIWEGIAPCPDTRFTPPPRRWRDPDAAGPAFAGTGSGAWPECDGRTTEATDASHTTHGFVGRPEAAEHDVARTAGTAWNTGHSRHACAGDAADGLVGFRIEVVARVADAGLDLASLLGTPALLRLLTPAGDAARRPWHGLVSECDWLGSDGGLGRVRLLVEPWLAWLRGRQDARVFHERSVVEIVDAVFARAGAGFAAPLAWRWALADPDLYPRRGRCVQAHESDLAFVERLLRDEGLFCWFEHEANGTDPRQARHRLVVADHDAAFGRPVGGERVRYTGVDAARPDDGLTRWRDARRLVANDLRWASRDDRSAAVLAAAAATPGPLPLRQHDVPGHYAWPTADDARRQVTRRAQALAAFAARGEAAGSWRDAAAGIRFRLVDHPVHDGADTGRDDFLVVAVRHRMRNNTGADGTRSGAADTGPAPEAAQHRCELVVQPAALPFRALGAPGGAPEARVRPRSTAAGVTTAVVVGDGAPIATDRDHRVQLQFHWQRGRDGGHRLPAPEDGDATARSRSGGWIRVAAAVAGDDWGFVHPPRVGHEALVAFAGGDADRPLVIGVLYNGRPHADEAGAANGPGAAGARASTAPWFPGTRRAGAHTGHAHAAVLAGWRTRALAAGGEAGGAGNALVFDDSPGAERVELATSSARTRLQLGRLRQQDGNQLLQPRGHGLDLTTDAWGALRAGAGLLISAYRRAGSTQAGRQLDTDELQRRLEGARSLAAALMRAASAHGVEGVEPADPAAPAVPAVSAVAAVAASAGTAGAAPPVGGRPPAPGPADARQAVPAAPHGTWALRHPAPPPPAAAPRDGRTGSAPALALASPSATGSDPLARAAESLAASGGGTRPASPTGAAREAPARRPERSDTPPSEDAAPGLWHSPDLVLTAPAGVATLTPADRVEAVCGDAWRSGERLQRLAGGGVGIVAGGEVGLFAAGHADGSGADRDAAPRAPGIRLHAASGRVAIHANTGAARLSAAGDACVGSSTGDVRVTAPDAIALRAGGSAIRIDASGLVVSSPAGVVFAATLKELVGARRASAGIATLPGGGWELPSPEPARRSVRWQVFGGVDGGALEGRPYRVVVDGRSVAEGRTDSRGLTERAVELAEPRDAELWLGDGGWCIAVEDCELRPLPLDREEGRDDPDASGR